MPEIMKFVLAENRREGIEIRREKKRFFIKYNFS